MELLLLKIRLFLFACLRNRSRPRSVSFLKRFSYKDIKKATDSFRRVIDNSSHCAAYKAKFQNGSIALVKEVRFFSKENEAFYREVLLLGRLHHRHIVALSGFSVGHKRQKHAVEVHRQFVRDIRSYYISQEAWECSFSEMPTPMLQSLLLGSWFLVFENIENGSLKEHLNDPLKTPLNWRTRLQIAIDVAAALEYLLFFCDPPVYHISINSSTIMLDENFTAKLSDVGLFGSGGNQVTMPHSSCSEGKILVSECASRECGHIIFQLGSLILELITGQSSGEGGVDLIKWVQGSCFPKSIDNMIDPDLGNNYDSRELKGLLAVARLCVKSVDKPTIFVPQIFWYLQKKLGISDKLH